jgi:EmrB/QacA subfamily drug resistance transporter
MVNMSYKWQVMIVVLLGLFPDMMNTTISSIALPKILADFNENIDKLQMVTSAYLLGMAVSSALVAYLMGRFGIKRIWAIAQVFYLGSSICCGLAWNANSLIVFRIVMGLCGGVLVPIAMTLIFTTFRAEEQGNAMGLMGLPMVMAPAIGLSLGGYLVEYVNWRWCFYISVPIVFVSLLATAFWLKDTEKQPSLPLDFKSFFFVSVGFGLILYALSYASTWGWDDARTLIMLAVGLVCVLCWVLVALREKVPMLDVRIFAIKDYSLGTFLTLIVTVGMYGAMLLVPLYLQNIRGLGAFESGMIMLPVSISSVVGSLLGGRIYDKFGPRIPVIIGLVISGLATWNLSVLNADTSITFIICNLLVFGVGLGLALMPVMTYTLAGVPHKLTAEASSINTVLRSVFGSLGTAVFATLLTDAQKFNLNVLVQTLTPDSGITLQFMSTVQVYLQKLGMTLETARQLAVYILYQKTALQAFILAFEKVFIIGAIIMLVGIIPAFLMRHNSKAKDKKVHIL